MWCMQLRFLAHFKAQRDIKMEYLQGAKTTFFAFNNNLFNNQKLSTEYSHVKYKYYEMKLLNVFSPIT